MASIGAVTVPVKVRVSFEREAEEVRRWLGRYFREEQRHEPIRAHVALTWLVGWHDDDADTMRWAEERWGL